MLSGRFFSHNAADPVFNMAFDEWMFRRVADCPGSVWVRLYTWDTGTLTFGLNQRQAVAFDAARVGETPVIRRATGGRAVYHDPSELTYAVSLNPHGVDDSRLVGSVGQVYERLAESLQLFLRRLGIDSETTARSSPEDRQPRQLQTAPCFASVARHELTSGGRKVIASAQKQYRGAVLQHGSIKLAGVVPHPALAIGGGEISAPETKRVESEAFVGFAQELRRAFEDSLGTRLAAREMSGEEAQEVRSMVSWVRKNRLARRDPIKQTTLAKSL
jgi:lipoate-protein ligase A